MLLQFFFCIQIHLIQRSDSERSDAERPGRDAALKGCHDLQAPAFWEEEIGVMMRGVIETRCHD